MGLIRKELGSVYKAGIHRAAALHYSTFGTAMRIKAMNSQLLDYGELKMAQPGIHML